MSRQWVLEGCDDEAKTEHEAVCVSRCVEEAGQSDGRSWTAVCQGENNNNNNNNNNITCSLSSCQWVWSSFYFQFRSVVLLWLWFNFETKDFLWLKPKLVSCFCDKCVFLNMDSYNNTIERIQVLYDDLHLKHFT